MNRKEILDEAQTIVYGDRNKDYGEPIDNFTRTAKLLSGYLGIELGAVDVAIIQILLKVDRIKTSPNKDDHWVDIAGYAGCGGECAEKTLKEELEGVVISPAQAALIEKQDCEDC